MTMNKTILAAMIAALAAPLAVAPVHAQAPAQVHVQAHVYTQAELDQMLAPIALYPDTLLSQVLMAATYPLEVVEAARWSRANPGLQGDAAVRAVQNQDWDPSVKSLCAFPQILQRMDEKLEWTQALGDAFLAQETQVMDQVQLLRQRAETNGNLRSDERIRVVREGPIIVVRPVRPEYVYVPYYDPLEVYGTWWWPDYRPVYWAPWPGYVRPRPSYAFWWGHPIGISINFFFGDFDWGRRHVRVVHNSYYYRQPVYYSRAYSGDRTRWQHDPHHRRSVEYRQADVRQRFSTAQMERREAVRDERRDGRQLERRADRRDDRRDDRPAARVQSQPAPTVQSQPQRFAQPRAEQRDDRREAGRADNRAERQAAPAATPAQRTERRADRREDRRVERQAPAAAPAQPAAQPRAEQRDDRRAERQAAMETQRQAQQQARQQEQAAQRQAQEAQRQAQQQARQQAQAAQQQARQQRQEAPRAERQERREQRQNKREERGEKAG